MVGLVIGGLSALAGSRAALPRWLERDPRVGLAMLIPISLIGVAGFAVSMPHFGCD